ncbi:MAG: TIGR03792 family protein [Scytolyngbya sp. HA4215-MV1]|nr:TIGR03792 family protein [Scytolyngbya sp. HA4215-MV1]
MVIEWLKFKVSPELREQFIQTDEAVWDPLLESYPGFLGKEIWINPQALNEVICVIHWTSQNAWKAVPDEVLQKTEQAFAQRFGYPYEMVEGLEYQVRKFPR